MGLFYVLEFGGQHTDLIKNRLLDLGYKAKTIHRETRLSEMQDADGFILSGSWKSVGKHSYGFDKGIFNSGKSVLGICFGMQAMAEHYGGQVLSGGAEYGESEITLIDRHPAFEGIPKRFVGWNNHGDYVVPQGKIELIAVSDKRIPAAIAVDEHIAVQYHPELTHTEKGPLFLDNFARLCGATKQSKGFNAQKYFERAVDIVKNDVGKRKAICLVSGGVDSSVCYGIAVESGIDVTGVHFDTGLQRKGEADWVKKTLERQYGREIIVIDSSNDIFRALGNLRIDTEKRLVFQAKYDGLWIEAAHYLGMDPRELVYIQGTLLTDKKESGTASGEEAQIKRHHNTGKPEKTTEPLDELSKGEARVLARHIGLPIELSERTPFPGPGLSIRLIGASYPYPKDLPREVHEIAQKNNMAGYALRVKTVGIKGDGRSFEHVAVVIGEKDWGNITNTSKILAERAAVNRTVYLSHMWLRGGVTSKDIIEVNSGLVFDRQNINLLQEATEIAERAFEEYGVKPSQLPVIAFKGPEGACIAIRDVDSVDFRSVRPLRKPDEVSWELCDDVARRIMTSPEVQQYGVVDGVVFDVSTKPAATTEWE